MINTLDVNYVCNYYGVPYPLAHYNYIILNYGSAINYLNSKPNPIAEYLLFILTEPDLIYI